MQRGTAGISAGTYSPMIGIRIPFRLSSFFSGGTSVPGVLFSAIKAFCKSPMEHNALRSGFVILGLFSVVNPNKFFSLLIVSFVVFNWRYSQKCVDKIDSIIFLSSSSTKFCVTRDLIASNSDSDKLIISGVFFRGIFFTT